MTIDCSQIKTEKKQTSEREKYTKQIVSNFHSQYSNNTARNEMLKNWISIIALYT